MVSTRVTGRLYHGMASRVRNETCPAGMSTLGGINYDLTTVNFNAVSEARGAKPRRAEV